MKTPKFFKVRKSLLALSLFLSFTVYAPMVFATDTACLKYQGDKDAIAQCESDTPSACLGINRTTPAGENKFEQCLSVNALSDKNPIGQKLNEIVNFLSAGVGIVVVASVIVGGIQYSIAGDNPARVTAAKKRVIDALIALLIFMFIFAFVQWLIPGGIFG
ncbi:MAG TPA: pilin [Candidatus Binatia bacterium]|nr:pilin [Candidatus Binatia bacterium]